MRRNELYVKKYTNMLWNAERISLMWVDDPLINYKIWDLKPPPEVWVEHKIYMRDTWMSYFDSKT